MPSTSTLPEPSNPPQDFSVVGGSHLDRMQAEVQALHQQAQVTQLTLKKLQTRESASPYSAIVSDIPRFVSGMDSTMLGVGSALVLTAAFIWWYVWYRPRNQWIDASPAALPSEPMVSTRASLAEHGPTLHAPGITQPPALAPYDDDLAWDPNTLSGDTTQPFESGHSPFTRNRPNIEFDSEAAAGEVTRVRKNLANKREARANLQDRGDSAHAELDLNLDDPLDPTHDQTPSVRAWLSGESATAAFDAPEPDKTPTVDLDLDLDLDLGLVPPNVPQKLSRPEDTFIPEDDSVSFSLVEPELALAPSPTPMPDMEPAFSPLPEPKDSGSKGYDFTITLALAQESAALELWSEARDLASEVLESDNPKLRSEALSLVERLNQIELEAPADILPRNGVR